MKRGLSVLIAALWAAQGEGIAQSPQPALQSHWRDVDIVIDGSHAEWSELSSFGKGVPFSVGLKNDGASVYVVLSSSDQSVPFLLMRRGLIVWFDAKGGTKKRFGIRYPVIEGGGGPPMRRSGGSGQPGGPPREPGREPGRPPGTEGAPPEPSGPMFDPAKDGRWARLELLGPGKDDRRSLVLDRASGIEVRIGRVEGSVVYELKVPLLVDDGHPYAIGARPGATIGVGLETPDVEKPESAGEIGVPGMGGRRPGGGGMGGGGMGGGPPMGGRPPGGPEGFKPPKPIKAWATVRLALVVVQP